MRKGQRLALAGLVGGLGLVLVLATPVHSQKKDPRDAKDDTLAGRLAKATKFSEQDVNKFMQAFGPAVQEELRRGRAVSVPGLGTFRVVRVPEHKDMQVGSGRPVTVAASNTVEFIPAGELGNAANSTGAVPAETVPPFEYVPLPGQTPGQRTPRTRTPGQRTP